MTETNPVLLTMDQDLPIACDVHAIADTEKERWMQVGREMYSSVDHVTPVEDGLAMRLPSDRLTLLAEYVTRDRLCCAFLRWNIVVSQDGGPLWLVVQGPKGTQGFLRRALSDTDMLRPEVAAAAGLVGERAEIDGSNVETLAARVNAPRRACS